MRIFESEEKFGRKIYLTQERWKHISRQHPEVAPYLEEFRKFLLNPTGIKKYDYDKDIVYYYNYLKERESSYKYLLIIVKYLNGEGFIITAYFVRGIL